MESEDDYGFTTGINSNLDAFCLGLILSAGAINGVTLSFVDRSKLKVSDTIHRLLPGRKTKQSTLPPAI